MTHTEIKEWTAAQDWTLRDIEIARLTGVAYSVVRGRRISAGIPAGKRTLTPKTSKWAGVDWSKSNQWIAAERGVSRQCVSLYRKRFAAQSSRGGRGMKCINANNNFYVWVARDSTAIMGIFALCLFRHKPQISNAGFWQTSKKNGRWPVDLPININPGDCIKLVICNSNHSTNPCPTASQEQSN